MLGLDVPVAEPARAGPLSDPLHDLARGLADRLRHRRQPLGEAPAQRLGGMRKHHRVGRPVVDGREAHERLGHDVVQAVPRDVGGPAGEQGAESQAVAVRAGPAKAGGQLPDGAMRDQRRRGIRADGQRRLDRVGQRIERAGRQPRLGLGGREPRVVDDHVGPHPRRRRVHADRVAVPARHLGGGERGGRRRHAPRRVGRRQRLGDVDHAAPADGEQGVARHRSAQPGRDLVHATGRHVVDGRGALDERGRALAPPRRGEQHVADPDLLGHVREGAAAEADHALAVLPAKRLRLEVGPGHAT